MEKQEENVMIQHDPTSLMRWNISRYNHTSSVIPSVSLPLLT